MSTAAPRRRLVAAMVLLLVLAALALATLGASADRGTVTSSGSRGADVPPPPPRTLLPQDLPPEKSIAEMGRPPGEGGPFGMVLTVLGVIAVIALLALMVSVLLRMRRLKATADAAVAAADLPEETLTQEQARAAMAAARQQLTSSLQAQDAVIFAWMALERAIAEAGIRRDPSQTTLEFVITVLSALSLREADLHGLAVLYRRALFDAEPLRPQDRDLAITLLDTLSQQLSTLRTGTPHTDGEENDAS